MQRIATLSAFLLLFGWATSRPSPAAAQGEDQCRDQICRFDYEVRQTQDLGSSGREARRCTGTWTIGVILPGSRRNSCKELVYPRQVAMYLAREETGASLPQIGEAFGGRDHTTVLYGIEKVQSELEHNERLRREIMSIRERLYREEK